MNIKQYFGSVRAGVALALGFAGSAAPEFIKSFGDGSEGEIDFDKSTFEVTTNMVKRQESSAFGKLVGNVSIAVKGKNNQTEQVRVDMGTFATLLANGGKCVLKSHQVTNQDGTPYKTRSGKDVYNLLAVDPIAYTEATITAMETELAKLAPLAMA